MKRLLLVSIAFLAACGGVVEGVDVPDGFDVEVIVEGLSGPTQIALAPSNRLLVAQLAGGENDESGQVLAFDLDDLSRHEVLFEGLDKPTGVGVLADEVWVMQRRSLWRGPPTGGTLEPVVQDLPFNGRSEGTLTPTPDGRLLYDTSGDLEAGAVVDGSGTLWTVGASGDPEVFATGFKHAYAHVIDRDGRVWATEVSDGSFDGTPAHDEVVAVEPGVDHGWPRCVGDNRPVEQYGGTERLCAGVPRPVAVFEPGATPTSVAIAPWDADLLVVALWNRGQVVTIDTTGSWPAEPEPFLTGIEHPQHLLTVGDRLLVVDFDGGRLLAVSR